jgi:hypothetical protein
MIPEPTTVGAVVWVVFGVVLVVLNGILQDFVGFQWTFLGFQWEVIKYDIFLHSSFIEYSVFAGIWPDLGHRLGQFAAFTANICLIKIGDFII